MAKVIFIQDIAYEYFGVMNISAYLKAHGHHCDVLVENLEPKWLDKVLAEKPDLIAFSVLTGSFKWALEKCKEIKDKIDRPIIFGGVHVYTNPAETIKHELIDIVCTGEGEVPITALCDSIDNGKMSDSVTGLWFKKENGEIKKNPPSRLIEDLDNLPFADRSIYWKYPLIEGRTTFPILGSLGCPYNCAYCFIPTAKKIFEGQGTFVRQRSAENIISEIKECLKLSPKKQQVHFVEDHFGNNRPRTIKILSELSKLKNGTMRWAGSIRVERFNREEYVKELAKTNHGILGIAVECGNENYRNTVLNRETKNEEIIETADLANKYGIKFVTLNMLGLPGETYEMGLETLDLNIRIKPVYANCYIYQPYPNTELQHYSVEHKYFEENVTDTLGFSWYDRYNKKDPEIERLINLQRVFGIVVKFPKLKPFMLKLVEWRAKYLLDLIFGFYYMWWLWRYYRLTVRQIYESLVLWLINNLKWEHSPATVSVKSGDAQLYTDKVKGSVQ